MKRGRIQQPGAGGGGNMIMGGGDSSGMAYVDAEMLKQVDVPVETLLGATNGAITGAVISAVVSGAVSIGRDVPKRGEILTTALKNLTGKHMVPVLVGTGIITALGGIVRWSRARKHNQWSDQHYAFLMHEQAATDSQVAKVEQSRETANNEERNR